MQREPERLTRDPFDVLVVGGGVHGLFAAYDAALRGLKTAVVDRGDFGGELSANHQRTLHGGLRALQSGDVRKMRAQIAERRTWARIAPHLIRPMPFLFGTYRSLKKSRTAVRLGFKAYDWFARHRNDGVTPELHLPKGRLESAAATRRLFKGVGEAGLTGGAIWYDYQTSQAERLTWCVALAAARAGAAAVNYVRVDGPAGHGAGVSATDLRTGQRLDIRCKAALFAAGEGARGLHAAFGLPPAPPVLRAMNLLIDRPAMDMAFAAPGGSGRMLTAVPWRGMTLVGTSQSALAAEPGSTATDAEIDAFLTEANAAFPKMQAGRADVRAVQQGLVPAVQTSRGLELLPDFQIVSGPDAAGCKAVSIVGAKYTTGRLAAERAVDAIAHVLGQPRARCLTATRPLPHAEIADVEGHLIETAREIGADADVPLIRHLGGWYGTEAPDVLRYAAASPWRFAPLSTDTSVLCAEVAYAVEHAMAVTAADALYRRTNAGGHGPVSPAVLARAEEIVAATAPGR